VIVAVCELVTAATVAVNEADVPPAAMVTLAGTVAFVLLLERATFDPPDNAREESVAVQVEVPADVNVDGEQESPLTVGRLRVVVKLMAVTFELTVTALDAGVMVYPASEAATV